MLSLGMLTALASVIAYRRRRFESGSPPPILAATIIAFESLVHSLPRLASTAALRCLIFAQGEWPAMRSEVGGQRSEVRNDLARLLFGESFGRDAARIFAVMFLRRRQGP